MRRADVAWGGERMPPVRPVVIVPTYNEVDNVGDLLVAVRAAAPGVAVLVIDDDSPDGTATRAQAVADRLGGVTVLERVSKDGLGNAYRAGIAHALADGHDALVTMDADFSHDPAAVPILLAELGAGADLVIGSRYVPGGSTPDWPLHRRWLSRSGNRYAAWALGLSVRDATSGLRAYRADLLGAIDVTTTRADGYAFMTELAHRSAAIGAELSEVPITFTDRVRGRSKMSAMIIVESMARVTAWGLKLRWRTRRASRRGVAAAAATR